MKFHRKSRERGKVGIDLTPMIDVVFQLVLFFMLSSTFVVQSSIQIEMPEAEGAAALEQKDFSVTLTYGDGGPDGAGRIFVDNEEVRDWKELSERLAMAAAQRPDLLLLIRADGRVPMARTVKVWGYATSVGIRQFGVAAQPPPEEK